MTLFRTQVIEQHASRLHGEVVVSQPLSTKLLAGALFGIFAVAALWVSWGTYTRIETVPGRLVTNIPSAEISASQPGVVSSMAVSDGERVNKGDLLLVINSDRQSEAGCVIADRRQSSPA